MEMGRRKRAPDLNSFSQAGSGRLTIPMTGTPISVHPVITQHPVTGKKVIYVNTDFTSKINELPALESERVLRFLIDHCNKPEWTCRFRWHAHSIAFWDNRCTHHKAIWDYWPYVRSGYRI